MLGSCPHVAVVVVLVCPHFPSLRIYILCWFSLMICSYISAWNDWFMTSCSNGCGVGLPSLPVSPIYTLLISLMMSSYSSFYDDVLYPYYCCTDSRPFFFPVKSGGSSWNFESWSSEKGVNSKWKTKKKTCPCLIGSWLLQRSMARFSSCI